MGKWLGFHDINDDDTNIGLDKKQLDRLWLGEAPAGGKNAAVSTNSIWGAKSVGLDRHLSRNAGDDDVGLPGELDDAVRSLSKHKL